MVMRKWKIEDSMVWVFILFGRLVGILFWGEREGRGGEDRREDWSLYVVDLFKENNHEKYAIEVGKKVAILDLKNYDISGLCVAHETNHPNPNTITPLRQTNKPSCLPKVQ